MYKSLKIQFWTTGIVSLSLLIGCYSKNNAPKLDIIEDQMKVKELINAVHAFLRVGIREISQAYEAEQGGKKLLFVPADAVIEEDSDELKAYTILKVEQNNWNKLIQKAHPGLTPDRSVKLPDNAITDEQKIKGFINSLLPTEILKSSLCGDQNDPPLVIYETKSNLFSKHIFVEEPALQIATRYLGYEHNAHFKNTIMVVVAHSEDWKALDEKVNARRHEIEESKQAAKSRLDLRGKLSEKSAKESIRTLSKRGASPIGISESKLLNAYIIPPTGNDIRESGINIAAKTINMLAPANQKGYMSKDTYYEVFKLHAPKSFGEKVHNWGSKTSTGFKLAGVTAAVIAIPATGGASSLAIPLAFLVPSLVDDLLPTDLGISPGQLAEYSTGYLGTRGAAEYESHTKFENCVQAIRSDIKKGKPVIVFWTLTSKSAQYAAVVGATNTEFIVMQPDGFLYRLSYADMKTLMKRRFWSYVGVVTTHKNYHLVRFKDTAGQEKGFLDRVRFWRN